MLDTDDEINICVINRTTIYTFDAQVHHAACKQTSPGCISGACLKKPSVCDKLLTYPVNQRQQI